MNTWLISAGLAKPPKEMYVPRVGAKRNVRVDTLDKGIEREVKQTVEAYSRPTVVLTNVDKEKIRLSALVAEEARKSIRLSAKQARRKEIARKLKLIEREITCRKSTITLG